MTTNDYKQRGFNLKKMQQYYDIREIKQTRFSLKDSKEKDFITQLFTAAQHLNNMVNS
jgi:hypothetical protein